MIIHLKKYKEHGYLKAIFLIIVKLFFTPKYKLTKQVSLKQVSGKLVAFPRKAINQDDQWKCTTCYLCSDVCPVNCIEIKGEANQGKLTEGNLPKSFQIDLVKCSQCGLCVDVCPTAALDLKGEYSFQDFNSPINFLEKTKDKE